MKIKQLIPLCYFVSTAAFAQGADAWSYIKKIQQEMGIMKAQIQQLQQVAGGGGIPSTTVDHYMKTGTCTALTTQPSDACPSGSLVCYNTDSFVDSGSNSLAGYTFTAVKSTPDAANKDGGVYLCDNSFNNLSVNVLAQCTSIGSNRHASTNVVEFTIPTGATDARVVAATMNSLGVLTGTSALTAISVCKTVGVADLSATP